DLWGRAPWEGTSTTAEELRGAAHWRREVPTGSRRDCRRGRLHRIALDADPLGVCPVSVADGAATCKVADPLGIAVAWNWSRHWRACVAKKSSPDQVVTRENRVRLFSRLLAVRGAEALRRRGDALAHCTPGAHPRLLAAGGALPGVMWLWRCAAAASRAIYGTV